MKLSSSSDKPFFAPYEYPSLKDKMGRYRTQSLFWEFRHPEMDALFTLKDDDIIRDDVSFLSLKKIYFLYDHVPHLEYEFAKDVFNSWEQWMRISNESIPEIRDVIKEWREELDIKLKAESLKNLITCSKAKDIRGFNASKYLAEQGYAQKRGRPSKAEVERERKVQAGVSKELESDMERLGLTVINGSK
jgi:hypothetical protein